MDHDTLQRHLAAEAAGLQAACAAADPEARVPTCPDWTTTDLLDHVTETYDHKIATMRRLAPPGGDFRPGRPGTPSEQFASALADLQTEFDQRGPDGISWTWHGPDQTVGFWIRRLTHETLIHRVDAELAAGQAPGPIDPALAADGVDEMLTLKTAGASHAFPARFGDTATSFDGLIVAVDAGERAWTVHATGGTITVTGGVGAGAQAVVRGDAGTLMLWLWRRVPVDAVQVEGDPAAAAGLYELVGAFGQ